MSDMQQAGCVNREVRGWWGFSLLALALLLGSGCAEGMPSSPGPTTLGPSAGDTGEEEEGSTTDADAGDTDGTDDAVGEDICLLNNCDEDLHCAGCDENRNTCDVEQHRCVACNMETGEGCAEGEYCTEWGNCVPDGVTCPADAEGVPQIVCLSDADCAACDPLHQLCDTATSQCVACTANDESHCQTTEHCVMGACAGDCPESCNADADCSSCGGPGHEAHACNAHQCAECSETFPCPPGQECNPHGVCVDICGLPGQIAGTCDTDADCAGCPGDASNCNAPINGGHGECGPEAAGCSDLGQSVVVLPEPFDEVTNLCSDDGDCAGVGIDYNVGELLRDITGIDSIDDAIIEYPMAACAAVTVGVGTESISCGVCVPCETDSDCMDIDVDEVAGDAFGPLGAIATAILLDQLFGPNSHTIHMFCQPVAAGYGACLPCPTLINDCTGGGGGGGGSGSCDHDPCTTGGPLAPSCGSC